MSELCPSQAAQDRTAALMARAATLHAVLAVAFARSRSLIDRVHQRRRAHPLRIIRGGSDAALVIPTIADAALCLHCIAKKTGMPVEQVTDLLLAIAKTLRLAVGPRRCDLCLKDQTTFSVVRSGKSRSLNQRHRF